jgi:hypothetical protein
MKFIVEAQPEDIQELREKQGQDPQFLTKCFLCKEDIRACGDPF